MRIWLVVLAACLGGAVASFVSLAIARVPNGRSILRPASHCDDCQRPLRSFENVPIVGYVVVGGRCRTCRSSIPLSNLVLEVIGALIGAIIVFALTA